MTTPARFIFFLCFLSALSTALFAAEQTPLLPKVETYQQLVHAIREVRTASQKRIEQAVAQENVREAWETGKLIDTHVLFHKERADYGEQVLIHLAKDLNSSDTELRYSLRFARAYPIQPPAAKLSWSHYRELLTLNDAKERNELAEEAVKERWNRDQIREAIHDRQAGNERRLEKKPQKLPAASPGKLQTYRIVPGLEKGQLMIDLGFSNYLKFQSFLPAGSKTNFEEGNMISVSGSDAPVLMLCSGCSKSDLYTYEIRVLSVVDGDTLHASVDLGFGIFTVQTLRLRGLDAPEIESRDGKEAKKFLEEIFLGNETRGKGNGKKDDTRAPFSRSSFPVVIRTVKSDKYDRYLADLFVDGVSINQKLVEEGLATVVED